MVRKSSGAKRPKLTNLAGAKYITADALSAILTSVRDEGLPDAISSSSYRRERKKRVYVDTPFGPPIALRQVQLEDGIAPETVAFQNPYAMLWLCCTESINFRSFFYDVCVASDFLLDLVFYTDGITCGNPLLKLNDRKVQALYWSVMAFGYPVLSNASAWFVGFVIRESVIQNCIDKLSAVVADFMTFFLIPWATTAYTE